MGPCSVIMLETGLCFKFIVVLSGRFLFSVGSFLLFLSCVVFAFPYKLDELQNFVFSEL